jgi:hypothetical protein
MPQGRRDNGEGSVYQTDDGRWRAYVRLDGNKKKYLTVAPAQR